MPDEPTPLAAAGEGPELSLSPFGVANMLLRCRRLLVACVGLGTMVGLGFALTVTRHYQADVLFVTSPGRAGSAGGVLTDLGPIQERDPVDYYTTVLASSAVADDVLADVDEAGRVMRDRLGVPPSMTAGEARAFLDDAAVQLLTSVRARSGMAVPVLTIRARWTDPHLAAELANTYFRALAKYDYEIRTTAAKDRGEFLSRRVEDTYKNLTAAETALRTFKEQNRLLTPTPLPGATQAPVVPPQLEERRAQLQREVDLQNDLYLSLKKALDQAVIAEKDDGSAMVVVESAEPPRAPVGGARRQIVWLGTTIGLLCGLGLALVLELGRMADLGSPAGQEFLGHLRDIRRQWRTLRAGTVRSLSPPVEATRNEHQSDHK